MAASEKRLAISKEGSHALPAMGGGSLAADAVVKRGWLCAYNSDGYLVPFTEADDLKSAGLAECDADATDLDDGAISIPLVQQVVDLAFGDTDDALTDEDIGVPVFGMDNQTVGKTDGGSTRSVAGIFLGINENTGKARVWVGPAAWAAASPRAPAHTFQKGTLTLVNGTKTLSTGITITSSSKVFVSLNTPGGDAVGVAYKVPDAGLVVGGPGTGAFAVTAIGTDKTTETDDASTLNYLIVD